MDVFVYLFIYRSSLTASPCSQAMLRRILRTKPSIDRRSLEEEEARREQLLASIARGSANCFQCVLSSPPLHP